MKIPQIKRTIRNTKRLTEIVATLSRFGFRQMIIDTGLQGFLDKTAHSEEEPLARHQPKRVRVRLVLEKLGPSFIKLGQILSTRPDLVPPEWCKELAKLQSHRTPVPFSEILEVLEENFPTKIDELFPFIEETPLAAASIAQVHRAHLKDGSKIVLKIIRPGNRKLIEEDMVLLATLAGLLEQYFSNLGYSPNAVAREFSRQLSKEIDFVNEGQSTDRLRKCFSDDNTVYFPKVFWEATTRDVLALEEIEGQLLNSIQPKDLTSQQRRNIVACGTDAVFRQCLEFGIFHADPHPGNIILKANGQLCFIDCGMTGRIDSQTTHQLINLVSGIIQGDTEKMRRVVIALTNIDPNITLSRDFHLELQYLAAEFQSENLDHFDITTVLSQFFSLLQRYKIQCPSDLLLLTKALTTIEGVAEQFDSEFDVIAHVKPRIEKVVMGRYSMEMMKKRFFKTMGNYIELLEEIPADIQNILDRFRRDSFTFNLELRRIEHLADKIDGASRIMGMSMIIAALIVGSSILILADSMAKDSHFLGTIGLIGLGLAGIASTGFVISFILPRKKNKD